MREENVMKQDAAYELPIDLLPSLVGYGLTRTLQDVRFRVLTTDQAVRLLDMHVQVHSPLKIAIANAHTLNIARANAQYRHVLSGFTVLNDGIGIDLASRMRYGQSFPDNLNGTDFVPAYFSRSALKLRVFMLGARPHVVKRAFDEARRLYPAHEWLGFGDGFFSPDDEVALCERIRAVRPDVLLVAMGNPLQEFWIERCAASTDATLCVGVGALFDFLSGDANRAPLWVRRAKLEWIYRLLQEPGRMWRRYLVGNLTFLWHAWQERR